MKKTTLAWPSILLALSSAAAALAFLLWDPLPLQSLRHQLFDQYQRWQPRVYEAAPVKVIDLDEESLARLGQWPWPRTRIAELVAKLNANGVAAIGFDVLFAEADRTSPTAISSVWPLDPALRAQIERLPDHDALLASQLKDSGVVLGFAVQRGATAAPGPADQKATPYRYVWSGQPATQALHPFTSAVRPLPVLQATADGLGALTFVPDADGVVRRVPLVLGLQDTPVPSLAAETLRVGQGSRNYILKSEAGGTLISEIRIGDLTVPTTPQGEMWVHYTPTVAERTIPAWQVIEGTVPLEMLEGHLVLIGSSAQGLMDLRFNPLGRLMPGVEAHAQALEQILTEHHLQRPGWAQAAEAVVTALGLLLVVLVASHTSALVSAAVTAGTVGGVMWAGWWLFSQELLLVNTLTPALLMGMGFVLASLMHHFWSEKQHRWVKEAFSRYVSPNRVEHLVNHPGELALGGQRRECSFIFTDLAGFTTLMEKMDPAEAVALLNAYLDGMIAIAFRYEGTLDRIVGDAVAIVFSAPVPQADHRSRALACAMEMHAFATNYANTQQSLGRAFGHTRLGIHSGEVIVGNFGGSTMFDYRALGDPVNTAARLESVNKHLGTRICVSEATLSGCPDAKVRPIGRLVLKGKTQALKVYEPLGDASPPEYAELAQYQAAYEALAAGDRSISSGLFETMSNSNPADPLVRLHLKRLQEGALDDLIVLADK